MPNCRKVKLRIFYYLTKPNACSKHLAAARRGQYYKPALAFLKFDSLQNVGSIISLVYWPGHYPPAERKCQMRMYVGTLYALYICINVGRYVVTLGVRNAVIGKS
jgi:hypothetical protein